MALPKSIQQQVEDADRMVAVMNGTETVPPTETPPQDPPQDPPPSDPPPSDPPQDPPAPISQEPKPEPKWESKYHTLKGMYDAEVPRLHAQLKELQQQMQQLVADKAVLESKATQTPDPSKSLITEQDKEAFGSDLIDLIERATEAKVSTLRDRETELVNEIKELKSQLGNVSERQGVSDKDRFLYVLGQQVDDWEALNVNPGFIGWLAEVDPVYGVPRQAALNSAYEVLDADRVAGIFKAYKASLPPTQPAPEPKSKSLQSQVAPTRTRASSAPAASDASQRVWTQSEIAEFYTEWRRGFLENDEAVRLEKEIHAAISEGRVRP